MTTRAEQLAARFEAGNSEVIATVTGCSDEQWRRLSSSEGWPVGVVAHHIAEVQQAFTRIVEALAAGETYSPTSSMEEVDRSNAQHASDCLTAGRSETVALLRASGAAILQRLRSLNDEQLDRVAGLFGGRPLSVAQVLEFVVIGHTSEHLASIRVTAAD